MIELFHNRAGSYRDKLRLQISHIFMRIIIERNQITDEVKKLTLSLEAEDCTYTLHLDAPAVAKLRQHLYAKATRCVSDGTHESMGDGYFAKNVPLSRRERSPSGEKLLAVVLVLGMLGVVGLLLLGGP